jgi:acyl-CoA synthetase (AMP-forming)/AMP-acid ligase II
MWHKENAENYGWLVSGKSRHTAPDVTLTPLISYTFHFSGPNIMLGYLNMPDATAETVDKDGYLHTGDVAIVDENNQWYIVDRVKELIKYKGFQVAPAELEALLLTHQLIADCAVIGVYDPSQATELPRAYIKITPGTTANDDTAKSIEDFVAKSVANHKKLRGGVRFIDEIPKSAAGKILRKELRELANQEMKSSVKSKI